jgi:hypothetical protein
MESRENVTVLGAATPRLKNKSKFDVNELQLPVWLD